MSEKPLRPCRYPGCYELVSDGYLDITGTAMTWYWIAGGVAIGGIVAYVAMNGYDGLYEDLLKHLHGLAGKSRDNV
mgnify:CR=1 FL=1